MQKTSKRGRWNESEWQQRTRYALLHLGDPISLEKSPLCRLTFLEELAQSKFPNGIVARGRALNELVNECLREIEAELDGHSGVVNLKEFVVLTRKGMKAVDISKEIGISREHASRSYKRTLVELLTYKLLTKLR